jgi:peptide/nickel transport system substrate-binding protein
MSRRIGALLALVVGLALSVTACGGGDDGGGAPEDRASEGPTELRIAVGGEPRAMDAHLDTDDQLNYFLLNVYETLVGRDPDMELQPLLAESWEQDGRTWRFTLRQGVKFHDGTDLTAEDVAASYNRILDPKNESPYREAFMGGVQTVRAVDDYTVAIKSENPDPTVPAKLTVLVVAPSEWTSGDRMTADMMGTGPYKLETWDRGNEIVLTRNADYWGTPGQYETVRILFRAEDSVRVNALNAGEVDIAHGITASTAAQAPNVVSAPISEVMALRFTAQPGRVVEDPRVREAISLAIDREGLIEGVYQGEAELPKAQTVIPQVHGFNPDLTDPPFDPDRARQLLEEAGAVGAKLTLTVTQDRYILDREVGQALVSMLEDVGLQVEASYEETNKWVEAVFAVSENPENAPDMTFIGYTNEPLDSNFFLVSNARCEGPTSGFCDREITRAIEQAGAAPDLESREAQFQEVWRMISERHYFAPFAVSYQIHGVSEDLEWQPRPYVFMHFGDIQPAS